MNRAPTDGVRNSVISRARASVLVVDDVDANLLAMDTLLSDMGCEVVLAKSGTEALRRLSKDEFAVMLLDVQMPEMDGYQVAQHARQNPATRDVPIIFLTAMHDNEDSVLRGYGSGAVDFIFKPINVRVLRSKVRIFLELYRGRREIADAKAELEETHRQLEIAYQELQATQSQLVQSAKMASLGELVAGVAHEINNPLSFVVSHLGTARRSLDEVKSEALPALSEPARTHWQRAINRLSEMDRGLERIADLVVKLRTFSRLDQGERQCVSMRESVDAILTILGHRLKDRIEVETRFGEPDLLDCFPSILNQAIMNLITNAIDAIDGTGRISIETGGSGAGYSIAIGDTGQGIPEHVKDRVFDPFFTTKPQGQGTGLGLSISYSIVRKHGGTLELRDRPGGGTLATIRIPLSLAERAQFDGS
jgi:two-component system, NtrC family, sensor kinase